MERSRRVSSSPNKEARTVRDFMACGLYYPSLFLKTPYLSLQTSIFPPRLANCLSTHHKMNGVLSTNILKTLHKTLIHPEGQRGRPPFTGWLIRSKNTSHIYSGNHRLRCHHHRHTSRPTSTPSPTLWEFNHNPLATKPRLNASVSQMMTSAQYVISSLIQMKI